MTNIWIETLACALVVCIFYAIVWWLLGTYFFGLTNWILITVVILMALADIGAIHYLIRRRAAKSQKQAHD